MVPRVDLKQLLNHLPGIALRRRAFEAKGDNAPYRCLMGFVQVHQPADSVDQWPEVHAKTAAARKHSSRTSPVSCRVDDRKPELRQGLFMRSHGPVCNAEVLRQVLLWAETDRIAVGCGPIGRGRLTDHPQQRLPAPGSQANVAPDALD